MRTNQIQTKSYMQKLKNFAFLFLCLCSAALLASEIKTEDYPPFLQEIIALPEEEQNKRLYTEETITWKDFTFTYLYQNPVINAQLGAWSNNQFSIVEPDAIAAENQCSLYYSSHPDDIQRLWDACEKRELLREFFLAMVENPRKFCARGGIFTACTKFPPLGVSECACENTGAYNRLITDRRHNFENALLQDLRGQMLQKDEPVRIMSLGCGNLLQETILIGRLISEGFSSLDMTLVDFWENEEGFQKCREFFAQTFPEVTIQWTRVETICDVDPEVQFNLIYAIDFDDLFMAYEKNDLKHYDCLNLIEFDKPTESAQRRARIDEFRSGLGDIIEARGLLTSSGALFLGSGGQDIRISSTNTLQLFHQDDYCKKEPSIQSAPLDSVHILTNIHHPGTVFVLLISFLDRGCESIRLTLEERDYNIKTHYNFNGEEIEEYHNYKTTSHYFMKKLFTRFSDKIHVELVDDIRPFIEGAHATFLDSDYLRGHLSEYSGAKHTVILNRS